MWLEFNISYNFIFYVGKKNNKKLTVLLKHKQPFNRNIWDIL